MLVRLLNGFLAFSLLAASTHLAHLKLIHVLPARPRADRPKIVLPPLPVLKAISFGYHNLVADVLWLQSIQYFGTYAGKDVDLYPIFQAITYLDPRFEYAYIFGSYALADEGLAASHAITLLRFGIQHNPDSNQLMAQLGFVYYFYAKKYKEAADAYLASAEHGGHPAFRRLAAILYARGGSTALSRRMWTGIKEGCQGDKYCTQRAEHHLLELDIEDQLDAIVPALRRYRTLHGHYPPALQALGGGIPWRDPLGQPYRYDPVSGRVAAGRLPWDPKWKTIVRDRVP